MSINILDAAGNLVPVPTPNGNGRAAAANSAPLVLSTEDLAVLNSVATLITATNTAIAALQSTLHTDELAGIAAATTVAAINSGTTATGTVKTSVDAVAAAVAATNTLLGTPAPLPAGTAQIGSVGTRIVDATGAALTVKYAFADLTATGDIVAAVATKRIKVLNYSIVCGAVAASARFTSGTGPTSVNPVFSFAPAGGIAESSEFGLFQTAVGEKLAVTMSGTGPLAVRVAYVEA